MEITTGRLGLPGTPTNEACQRLNSIMEQEDGNGYLELLILGGEEGWEVILGGVGGGGG